MPQIVTLLVTAVVVAGHSGTVQDAVKVTPSMYTVLLENDQVRVLEFKCQAGQKEAMHSHPGMVAYSVTPAKFRSTSPEGKTESGETKAGTAIWLDPVTHAWECVSGQHTILTEMKGGSKR